MRKIEDLSDLSDELEVLFRAYYQFAELTDSRALMIFNDRLEFCINKLDSFLKNESVLNEKAITE